MVDRLFISNMVGMEATGLYSLGYQVGMIVYIVCTSFTKAWSPYMFKTLLDADEGTKKVIVRQFYAVCICFLGLLLFTYLFSPIIFNNFIDPKFNSAIDYVFWVGLGYVFYGMFILVVNYIYFVKKTKFLIFLSTGAALLNVVLNYFLISLFGAIGAAYSTAISFLFLFIVSWWVSSRVYPMPWFSFLKIS